MRILIDVRKAFDSGIGTYIRYVIPRVIEMSPEFEFGVLVEPGGKLRHDYLRGVRVDFVEIGSAPLGLLEQVDLRRCLSNFDYFWATSLAHPVFSTTPIIATVHDVAQLATRLPGATQWLVKAAAHMYFKSLRSTARLMVFNSMFTNQEFDRYVGLGRAQTLVTPLGVAPDWFDIAPYRVERPYLICVGNLRPHKNLRLLLQAFTDVKDELPHDLLLVGKPEGFKTTDGETRSLLTRLGTRVRLSGFLPDGELRLAVAGADALVLPSLYEGFGLPALEAMASGVAVIAARAAALPEVCGDCARYFDPMSRESLASQLRAHTAMTPSDQQSRISLGIARARGFTWERTARLTADAIGALPMPDRERS